MHLRYFPRMKLEFIRAYEFERRIYQDLRSTPLNPPASGGKRHSRCYEPPPVHGGIEGGYCVSPVYDENTTYGYAYRTLSAVSTHRCL